MVLSGSIRQYASGGPSDAAIRVAFSRRTGTQLVITLLLNLDISTFLHSNPKTKFAHCIRVANQNLPAGQSASYPAQLDVKRKYELGEWSVPCYSLRCVGFNMPLYDALCAESSSISTTTLQPVLDPRHENGKRQRNNTDGARNKRARSSSGHSPKEGTDLTVANRRVE